MSAALVLGQVATNATATAQVRELAIVETAELPIYAHMDTRGPVIRTLMRGDLVEIDRTVSPVGSPWCSITEIGGQGTSGYVPCEALRQQSQKPSQAIRLLEQPTPPPPAERTAPIPTTTSEGRYSLQIASLVVEQNAISLKAQLQKMGYTPVIHTVTVPITHHRVFAGEFHTQEEAERAARQLNVDGFPSTVVMIAEGKFAPEMGSFLRLNQATDLVQALQAQNYAATITSGPVPTPMHQVRVGQYENRAEAAHALEELKKAGFAPLIVSQ